MSHGRAVQRRSRAGRAVVASLIGVVAVAANAGHARAASPWDDVGVVILPTWRLGPSFHASTLPSELTLCTPQNGSCQSLQTLPSGSFHRGPVLVNAVELGADLFSWGPLRIGFEGSYGAGTGPTTRLGTQAISGSWTRTAGFASVGLRLRGPARDWAWTGFAEVLPGIVGLTAPLQGPTISDQQVVASAGGFVFGARLGAGVLLNRWLGASVFGGVGFGAIEDVSVGLRLELRFESIHY